MLDVMIDSAFPKPMQGYLQKLRLEEFIFLFFLLPILIIAFYANVNSFLEGSISIDKLNLKLLRIGITFFISGLFYGFIWLQPRHIIFRRIRDFSPFLFVLAIYMNLQDTISLIHHNDIHYSLAAFDEWIFGVQPSAWAEKFYHPWLTDWFSFSYMSYYWMTLVLVIWLYKREAYQEFRTIMLTMMITYYLGFLGYLTFPAASPYLVIPDLYTVDIFKNTTLISDCVQAIVNLSPERARDAFPSLHNAITILTVIMAWRFARIWFWILLPFAVSLVLATIYLRYHFVVDIFGGITVLVVGWYLTPILERWWYETQAERQTQEDEPDILPG